MTSGDQKSPNAANGLLVNISRLLEAASILDGGARAGERRALCGHRELEYLVAHRTEIAQHPGRRRGEAGDGSRIDEPGTAALHGRDALDSSAQLQARVGAVVVQQPAARARQVVQREWVSQVVAVNYVNRYSSA